jgi:hypothetical protein
VTSLSQRLVDADRHIADFKRRIADQRLLIKELEKSGHRTEQASDLLRWLEEALRRGLRQRKQLVEALAKKPS